ncbi:MAG TPA: DUF1800 domain-containing protein [Terriglobales bacterium]|nr:DUF1800 domain-containing protein [Terriglobales bacterium]
MNLLARIRPSGGLLALAVLLGGLSISTPWGFGRNKEKHDAAFLRLPEQKRALHVLNRLSYGPRPGDLERVKAMGVDQWMEQQLHPEKMNDSELDTRLRSFPTLGMSTRELIENFPPPEVIRAVADGRQSLPSDPVKRAVYAAQLERYQEKQEKKQESNSSTADVDNNVEKMGKTAAPEEDPISAQARLEALFDLPPDARLHALLVMSPEQRRALTPALKGKSEELTLGMTPRQHEIVIALANPQEVVADELMQSKILRETYSERQLQEVMTDFWLNHFNVFIGKGMDRYFLTAYERDVIRPRVLGKFEDLLVATAQSPAMLFYLDNWLSVGPNSEKATGVATAGSLRRRRPAPRNAGKRVGLNENYGRELMELHTLGVNGGYTQKDVTEVARVFTGWTLKPPREGGEFTFDERMHDPGEKTVLGHRIKFRGKKEGLEVLHILARHPSTAKLVSSKLAVRFVSDNPPATLVNRMAQTFLKKDGDIREVLKTMFDSPEFWADDEYRAKVKTPLEFVVSALRVTQADISDATALTRQLQRMGMPLYGMQPPTGYSMKAEAWVNSSALLERMNFALALSAGRLKGVRVDWKRLLDGQPASPSPDASESLKTFDGLVACLLAGEVSQQTHETIAARLDDPQISQRKLDDPARAPNVNLMGGLLLGSPEFQRR